MTFFSVVVTLYNKQRDIKNTLVSALSQTYTDFELIVINDGSTDESEAKVLSVNDERLIYIKTENQGVSSARNLGITKAKGSYIAFLDGDDYWYPNHLEVLKSLAETFPEAGAIASNYEFRQPNGIVTNTYFKDISSNFKGIIDDYFKTSMLFRIICSSAVAVRRDVFINTGMFDTSLSAGAAGEDTDMWIRIAIKYPVAFNATITATYILGASNRISRIDTLKRSFPKLDKFKQEEKTNKSLQKFIDLYRASYALKHRLAGDSKKYNFYKKSITKGNIPFKTRLLLHLPAPLLRFLYTAKQKLKSANIDFDIYN